eukprot:COSAG04_NODE_23352_length_340_cov_0.634855_1_plen_23_part_10
MAIRPYVDWISGAALRGRGHQTS